MCTELGRRVEEHSENFNKELENIKKRTKNKETDIKVQEAQRISNKMNPKRCTSRHSIIKMAYLRIRREF